MSPAIALLLATGAVPAAAEQASAAHATTLTVGHAGGLDVPTGFTAVSEIRWAGAPSEACQLEAVYAPDRARLWIGTPRGEGRPGSRQVLYRAADGVWILPERQSKSVEPEEATRRTILSALALRRAWMLWPDGVVWSDDPSAPSARTADLGELGRLVAAVDPAGGRPTRIGLWVTDPDGTEREQSALTALTWAATTDTAPAAEARAWPAAAELWRDGELLWHETVVSVSSKKRYIDSFFLPPDRRDSSPGAHLERAQRIVLPERIVRRFELARGGVPWTTALERERELQQTWRERLRAAGFALDRRGVIEVDKRARPRAVVLRIEGEAADLALPDGWTRLDACPAASIVVPGRERVDAGVLKQLREALPPDLRAGHAYARIETGAGDKELVQVVLPTR